MIGNKNQPQEGVEGQDPQEAYFQRARQWYTLLHHYPMAERSVALVITVMSVLTFLFSLVAFFGFLPTTHKVPFAIHGNLLTDIPKIVPLSDTAQSIDLAMIQYFGKEYVRVRESYDIADLQLAVRRVKGMSSQSVYERYRAEIDPRNPNSPVAKYERHSQRLVRILSLKLMHDRPVEDDEEALPDHIQVSFEATVTNRNGQQRSYWIADIAFRYREIQVDQETFEVTPMAFEVTDYKVKETVLVTQ